VSTAQVLGFRNPINVYDAIREALQALADRGYQ
jgi:hypothetical protein